MSIAPGARIGDYTIEGELRSEATGVVYAAVHLVLPRRAAIKVLHPDRAWKKSLAVQLLREACILEALSHPGVPRIYECGVLADRRPWVAIERIDGAPLKTDAPIAIVDLVTIIRAIADILAHAHARGVVHHRLGEGVVILTPDRKTPLCVRGWGDVVTHDSHLAAEPTSDVHSLGALAYRALTGAVLTPGASARAARPEAPADLTKLIDDMLADDPALRPSAAEVCERADWLAETLETARPLRPATSTPVALARTESSDFSVRIRG